MSSVLQGLTTDAQHLFASRYLTAAGITVLLYDVPLTLPQEVEYVWSRGRWTLPRVAYLINRYGMCSLSLFFLDILFPFNVHSNSWCAHATNSVLVIDVFISTMGNGVVLHQLFSVWNSKRSIAWLMASGFIIMHVTTIAFVVVTIFEFRGKVMFLSEGFLRVCFTNINPRGFLGVYAPATVIDIYAFTLLLANALSKPRSASQKLLGLLYGDGVVFFMTTFSMRLMCLIITIVAPVSLSVLALNFGSSIVDVAVSRLYLRLIESALRSRDRVDSVYGRETLLGEDATELQYHMPRK